MADVLCPELIGRDAEFAALGAALAAARHGRGGLAIITGEPGVGKSRLAREIAALARRGGTAVVTGRAVPAGGGTAFRPLTEALAQALRDRDVPADRGLAPWLPALSAIVPGLTGAVGSGAPGGHSAAMRGEALTRLLRAIAGPAGLLTVLEDLHWADPDTLAVVEYLGDNLAGEPVLVMATIRSEPASTALEMAGRLHSRRCGLHLRLARLDDSQVARMVRACLPGAGEAVIARVQRTADGIPFLVEEVLAAPGVPTSFAGTVRARLAACGHRERLVLDAAAVLGRSFDWRLLPEVTALPATAVAAALEQGVANLLLATGHGGFRFRHALTRETLAQEMLPPRRAELAARALAVVESAGLAQPGRLDMAADLAEQAGQLERAADLLADAGERSLRAGALATAAATLERAAALLAAGLAVPRAAPPAGPEGAAGRPGAAPAGARIDELLTAAYALAGRVEDAVMVGERLTTGLAAAGAEPVRRARVHLRLAHAAVAASRWHLAAGHLDAVGGLIDPGSQADLAAQADVLRAEVALAAADVTASRALAEQVLAATRAGARERCQALELIGRINRISDLGAARAAFERALAIADAEDLPVWRLRALHELGTIELFDHVGTGRLAQARQAAGRLGALGTAAVLDLQLGVAHNWRFDLGEGERRARSAADLARRLGLSEVGTKAAFILAENSAYRLDRDAMERHLGECRPTGPGERYLEGFAWGVRGMAELVGADWARAGELMSQGTALLAELPHAEPAQFRAWWPALLAMSAAPGAAEAIEQARRGGVAVARPNAGLLGYAAAMLAGRAGETRAAEALAAAAAADMACVPVWHHLARACAAGPALADGWGQARAWLAQARECFARRGLGALEARCAELLARARPGRPPFTPREAEVLGLVARGLSNKDVAARLYLSPRTVEKHVESLLRKAGVTSRAQLAARFAREGDSPGM